LAEQTWRAFQAITVAIDQYAEKALGNRYYSQQATWRRLAAAARQARRSMATYPPPSRRTISVVRASPAPAAKHAPFHCAALLLLEPFTLSTKVVDFGVHPSKEEFSRGGGNPRPLKLEDFLALSSDLDAHMLDFGTNVI
jgi:hypothetical protein